MKRRLFGMRLFALCLALWMLLLTVVACNGGGASVETTTWGEETTTVPEEETTTALEEETTTASEEETTTVFEEETTTAPEEETTTASREEETTAPPEDDPPSQGGTQPSAEITLNGIALSSYSIVYNAEDTDYSKRAAEYIRDEIAERTGVTLALLEDGSARTAHEIVVGKTGRLTSQNLSADLEGVQFAIYANHRDIALKAPYFVIAAAAYYFVETYIAEDSNELSVPKTLTVCQPITQTAKNYIFLIGDGMGVKQTRLFEVMDAATSGSKAYSDGEDVFYGYLLPYEGRAKTNSLSGVTDSAAAATALASGFKTINGYVGMDRYLQNVTSLTELAASMGMATAVMSTEVATGATPASFSAHTSSRNNTAEIMADQAQLTQLSGTIIRCNYNYYDVAYLHNMEMAITDTLSTLSLDEDGFFLMYEEAYVDKHSHNQNMSSAFDALVRFNQAIGLFMEYAFYHPDTVLLITADHETGGMISDGNGGFVYTHGSHSGQDVPVFAYGAGMEVFHDVTVENVQIPKTFASMMGEDTFGDMTQYPSLIP
ncbi:MAG: alkaline phosphatase [Clostridia bacterium]|nr:alkaline phosphatase [Clostridia bacterium]